FVLGRPDDDSYELRLPNSQMLRGDRVHGYVKNENETMNMVYDWIVVHHPVVFCAGLAAGLLANLAGLRLSASPYLLLTLPVLALTVREDVAQAVAVGAATSTGVVTAAYVLVRRLRERSPIRTAKYGERNGYVAVLLLTAFIVLVCLELDLGGFARYAPTAVG